MNVQDRVSIRSGMFFGQIGTIVSIDYRRHVGIDYTRCSEPYVVEFDDGQRNTYNAIDLDRVRWRVA